MDEIGFINFAVDSFYLQILLVSLLFCWGAERRKFFYLRLVFLSLACLAVFFFFPKIIVFRYFNLCFFFIFVSTNLILGFCFKIKLKQLFVYNIAAASLQNLTAKLLTVFFIFGYERTMLQLWTMTLSFAGISVLFYFFYIKRTNPDRNLEVDNVKFVILFFVSFLTVFIFSPLCDAWIVEIPVRILAIVLLSVIDLMVLFAEFGVFEKSELKKENDIIERMLYLQKEQRELSETNIELINRKCHDMRHQMALLRSVDDDAERNKYISELEKSISIYDADACTGNRALDVVFSEYGLICEKKKIRFTYMIDGKTLHFIEASDLYSFFGNALENAIEALEKESEETKKILNVIVEKKSEFVVINIENYFSGELDYKKGLPSTTKQNNGYHGFGLKSIRYIAEKYNGNLSVFVRNQSFILQVLFPVAS